MTLFLRINLLLIFIPTLLIQFIYAEKVTIDEIYLTPIESEGVSEYLTSLARRTFINKVSQIQKGSLNLAQKVPKKLDKDYISLKLKRYGSKIKITVLLKRVNGKIIRKEELVSDSFLVRGIEKALDFQASAPEARSKTLSRQQKKKK